MKYFTKPLSLTSNEFIEYLKREKKIQNKACYCGRLDPMARGKMLVLEGNECKQMMNYLNNNKSYEFIIVFGMSTDTDDIMGLFENNSSSNNFSLILQEKTYKTKFKNALQTIPCREYQKYHKYSSYVLRKDGKRYPLWKWEKLGQLRENEIPTKKARIYELQEQLKYNTDLKKLLIRWTELIDNVNRKHKFRQKEIIQQYRTLIEQVYEQNKIRNEPMKVLCIKYKIKVSSGFYIRQFINDLKREINFPVLVYDINRIDIF